jgi:hypothetical protein
MCSGSEAGSYPGRIDVVYNSTLGLRVMMKKRRPGIEVWEPGCGVWLAFTVWGLGCRVGGGGAGCIVSGVGVPHSLACLPPTLSFWRNLHIAVLNPCTSYVTSHVGHSGSQWCSHYFSLPRNQRCFAPLGTVFKSLCSHRTAEESCQLSTEMRASPRQIQMHGAV